MRKDTTVKRVSLNSAVCFLKAQLVIKEAPENNFILITHYSVW